MLFTTGYAIRITPTDYKLYPFLLGTLITLKMKSPTIYKEFITGKASAFAVIDHIRSFPGGPEFLDGSNYGAVLEAYLVSCRARRHDSSEYTSYYQAIINNEGASEKEKKRASYILKLFSEFNMRDSFGILDYIVKKIEISSQFTV